MECYLDNAATTAVFPEVKDLMIKLLEEDYGNPSSLHSKGALAKKYMKDATLQVAKALKCQEKEIVFTSGGTEANNLAIIGGAMAHKRAGMHIITTCIEHASVSATMKFLEKEGFEITYLGVDKSGRVNIEELQNSLRPDTIMVSVMYVNNEIGTIEPVEQIGKIVKAYNEKILFHVDAIQAFGKMQINPKRMRADLISVSGHKIHGPKGSGALFIKEKTLMKPIIYGGGQQDNRRSGTENVPAIAGMGLATSLMYKNHEDKMKHIKEIRDYFLEEVSKIEEVYVNSGDCNLAPEDRNALNYAPHIASVSFVGVRSQTMLNYLQDKGIYVSAGSACSSNKASVSSVLVAIELPKERLESTLRFSFAESNTKEQIDYVLEVIQEGLTFFRSHKPRD